MMVTSSDFSEVAKKGENFLTEKQGCYKYISKINNFKLDFS